MQSVKNATGKTKRQCPITLGAYYKDSDDLKNRSGGHSFIQPLTSLGQGRPYETFDPKTDN